MNHSLNLKYLGKLRIFLIPPSDKQCLDQDESRDKVDQDGQQAAKDKK